MSRQLPAVRQANNSGRPAHLQPGHLRGEQHFRPEPASLGGRPPRQVPAPNPRREAEVVLDSGALASLAPRRLPLYQHGAQTLRGGVDGSTQAGWAAPDHDDVVKGERGRRREPEGVGNLRRRRSPQREARVGDDEWEVVLVRSVGGQEPRGLRVAIELEPPERHLIAGQEVLYIVRRARPAMSDDPYAVVRFDPILHLPVFEKVVEDRIQLLLRWVPWFQQVVLHIGPVDSRNGCVGVGVCGKEDSAGFGVKLTSLSEKLD